MKIEDYCMRCGVCIETCPEVFEMDEESEVMQVKMEEIPPELEKKALEAVENCGVGGIVVLKCHDNGYSGHQATTGGYDLKEGQKWKN